MRIHPAESRVRKLAHEHPATLIVFDVLVDERGRSLIGLRIHAGRIDETDCCRFALFLCRAAAGASWKDFLMVESYEVPWPVAAI